MSHILGSQPDFNLAGFQNLLRCFDLQLGVEFTTLLLNTRREETLQRRKDNGANTLKRIFGLRFLCLPLLQALPRPVAKSLQGSCALVGGGLLVMQDRKNRT